MIWFDRKSRITTNKCFCSMFSVCSLCYHINTFQYRLNWRAVDGKRGRQEGVRRNDSKETRKGLSNVNTKYIENCVAHNFGADLIYELHTITNALEIIFLTMYVIIVKHKWTRSIFSRPSIHPIPPLCMPCFVTYSTCKTLLVYFAIFRHIKSPSRIHNILCLLKWLH